jgi:hypothetical protein
MSKVYTVTQDPHADPMLTLMHFDAPGVKAAIAADMARTGHCTHCGECGKPFTLARKRRGVGRVRLIDAAGLIHSTSWLFCGRCHASMQRKGGQVSSKLVEQAREAAKAGHLAILPAKGRA